MPEEKLHKFITKTKSEADIYTPLFFRLSEPAQKVALEEILNKENNIRVSDTIASQLRELIKSRNPKHDYTAEALDEALKEHLNGGDIDDYGVWVYYPWSDRIVHIPDKEEFIELRTNRNKYKITDDEERILSEKKVGVVGLSVGQSVSLTMAIERTFGELRIADFDDLEITNLNRLRSGIHNMGLKKTVIVAREIAEIDPFLKVTPYHDGLNSENIDDFFTAGGKLDLVIDECDGLDMKIVLRIKAKALRVPVLMEASDRGTLDVERYDLEPERPLLHGFIDHLDHTKIGSLTNEQKLPFILPMLGIETISKRLKASMAEIKQTINTWPQLASAVTLGGALCADVCRRVLLGYYKGSGRFFVDIEDFIGDFPRKMEGTYDAVKMEYPELAREDMSRMAAAVKHNDGHRAAPISEATARQIVAAAIAAPSAGNNQPWKWLFARGMLYLFHDKRQSFSWTDEEDFIAQIALGAAMENVQVQAAALGYKTHTALFPFGNKEPLVAAISFTEGSVDKEIAALEKYLTLRCTNRKHGDKSPIAPVVLASMQQQLAAAIPEAGLRFLTETDDIIKFAEIESISERVRFMHPQSHTEFFSKELKWNDSGKEIINEGLDIKTLELSLSDETGLKVASDPGVIALLNKWETGKVFEKGARNTVSSSSAIGLISMPAYSPENYINGGRATQLAWLNATMHNIAVHPVSAPLLLYYRIKYGDKSKVTNNMIREMEQQYQNLCILFPELKDSTGIFLFRLSNAGAPTARALRKPLAEVYNAE